MMEEESGERYRVKAMLCDKDGGETQIFKALSFFSHHMNLLQKPYYKFMLMNLLFAPGKFLHEINESSALGPRLATELLEFAQRGYRTYMYDYKTAMFFLRLIHTLELYNAAAFPASPDAIKSPLNFIDELENRLEDLKGREIVLLESVVEAKWKEVLSRDYRLEDEKHGFDIYRANCNRKEKERQQKATVLEALAYCQRSLANKGELSAKELSFVFKLLNEYGYQPGYLNREARILEYPASQGFYLVTQFCQQLVADKKTAILDGALNPVFGTEGQWNYDGFPTLSHAAGKIEVRMSKGDVLYDGRSKEKGLPEAIFSHPAIKQLFPDLNVLGSILKGQAGTDYTFMDIVHKTQFRVTKNEGENSRLFMFKEGRWLEHYSDPLPKGISATLCQGAAPWYDKETETLAFLDRAGITVASYSFKSQELITAQGELAVCMNPENSLHQRFLKLDPSAQIYRSDKETKRGRLELPQLGLTFVIDDEGVIRGQGRFQSYVLAQNQHVKSLVGVPGLVFEHEITKKREVLVPFCKPTATSDLTKPLSFGDAKGTPYLIFDVVGKREKLSSPELKNRLYLASIYQAQNRFIEAHEILTRFAEKQGKYSSEELSLFFDIVSFEPQMAKEDPRVSLLILKAVALLANNQKRYGWKLDDDPQFKRMWDSLVKPSLPKPPEPPKIVKSLNSYLDLIAHVPRFMKLTEQEELTLCELLGPYQKRLQQLYPGVSEKTPAHTVASLQEAWRQSLDFQSRNAADLWKKIFQTIPLPAEGWKPNDDIFNQKALSIQPSESQMLEVFLDFYALAKETKAQCASAQNELREYLRSVMLANRSEASAIAVVLLGVLEESKKSSYSFLGWKDLLKNIKQYQNEPEWRLIEGLSHRTNIATDHLNELATQEAAERLQARGRIFQTAIAKTRKNYAPGKRLPLPRIGFTEIERIPIPYESPLPFQSAAKVDALFGVGENKLTPPEIDSESISKLKADLSKDIKMHYEGMDEQQGIQEKKRQLLDLANKALPTNQARHDLSRQLGDIPQLTWKHLQILFIKKNAQGYQQLNPALTIEDIQKIHALTEELLLDIGLQKQRIRALEVAEKIEGIDKQPSSASLMMERRELVQKLYSELSSKREYDPQAFPEILIYECRYNIRVRKDQADNIKKLTESPDNCLLEIIMGGGKSDVLLPLTALKNANGHNLSILITPKQLIDSVIPTTELRVGDFYQKSVNRFNWSDTTLTGLNTLFINLTEAIEAREFVVATPEEIHHFNIAEKAVRDRYASTFSSDDRDVLDGFLRIRTLFKEKGVVLIDEVDSQLRCDFEVHQSIGKPDVVDRDYRAITTELYRILFTDPDIAQHVFFQCSKIRTETAKPYHEADHKEMIFGMLAKALLKSPQFQKLKLPIQDLGNVLTYLTAEEKAEVRLPKGMDERTVNVLAYTRRQLQVIMPLTLKNTYGVNYGLFFHPVTGKLLHSIPGPFRKAKEPQLNSQFASYDEQLNYVFQSYQIEGIPQEFVAQEIVQLQNEMVASLGRSNKRASAAVLKKYEELVGQANAAKVPLMDVRPIHYKKFVQDISTEPDLFFRFTQNFILPQVSFYKRYVSSNAQTLPAMFKQVHGVSGSVGASQHSFRKNFSVTTDPTIAELTEKCLERIPEGLVIALKERDFPGPVEYQEALLRHVLAAGIASNRKMGKQDPVPRTLIDVGAWFKDVPERRLADLILEWGATTDPQIHSVVYFQGERRMILRRGAEPEEFRITSTEDPHRFTIYDQKRCVGTDIKQIFDANGIETVSKTTRFDEEMQGAWRMRKLDKEQTVTLAALEEVANIINPAADHPLTTKEINTFTKQNQKERELLNNKKAATQEINERYLGVCEHLLDRFLEEGDEAQIGYKEAYKALHDLTVNINEDAPFKQYGRPQKEEDAPVVLEHLKMRLDNRVVEWMNQHGNVLPPKSKLDSLLQTTRDEVDKTIEACTPHLAKKLMMHEDFLQESSVEVSQEQEQQQEQQQENEQEQVRFANRAPIPYDIDDLAWTQQDLFSKGAYKTTIFNRNTYLDELDQFEKGKAAKNPILSLEETLSLSFDKPIQGLFPQLTILADVAFSSKKELPFRGHQKPFGEVLLVQDKATNEMQLILLTKKRTNDLVSDLKKDEAGGQQGGRSKEVRLAVCTPNYELGRGGVIYLEGAEPIDRTGLFSDEDAPMTDFEKQLVQCKFIRGETSEYTAKELKYIEEWIRQQPDTGFFEREVFLKGLYLPTMNKYETSPLATIFKKVQSSP